MKLRRLARLLAFPVALTFTTLAAHADTFNWSLTGPAASLGGFPGTGSGTLTATQSSGDEWAINSISGIFDDSAITGLVKFEFSDNLLFPNSTFLDTDGLGFETANGTEVNVWSAYAPGSTDITPGNNYSEIVSGSGFGVGTFSLTPVAATPEPSTFALLGTGLLGAAGVTRRRFLRS
jgi:PEP-CTERM motif